MRTILILVAVGLAASYPLYKQCDSRWANDKLGSSTTICKSGCLMSSVAMFMNNGYTPGTLNKYMNEHGGYSGNLWIWAKAPGISFLGFNSNKD